MLREAQCVLTALVVCAAVSDGLQLPGWLSPWLQPFSTLGHHGHHGHSCKPHHVHISVHDDSSKMSVMWMTKESGCKTKAVYALDSAVLSPDKRWASAAMRPAKDAGVQELKPSDMCGKPATDFDYDTTYHHTVVLEQLKPNSLYWYCPEGSKRCYQFRSPRPAGSPGPFTFIQYGDMGESDHFRAKSPGAIDTAKAVEFEVARNDAELVLHIGDVSYADGDPAVWRAFMDAIEPYASIAPYMVAVGNHDYDYEGERGKDPSVAKPLRPSWGHGNFRHDSGGECGVALTKRFAMPSNKRGSKDKTSNSPFWYSFQYGPVHFIVLSSEHHLDSDSIQYAWLLDELKSVDRCTTPWLVVNLHRPSYVISPHHSNQVVGEHIRANLEDALHKHGADLMLSGHIHSWSRTCGVFEEACVGHAKGGIVNVIAGSAGHKLSRIKGKQPGWVDYAERDYGYTRVTVNDEGDGTSRMDVSFVRSDDGKTRNTITLTNTFSRDGTCTPCYARTAGVAPHNVTATCGSDTDLAELRALRLARSELSAAFLGAPLTREALAATSTEMDAQSEDDWAEAPGTETPGESVDVYVRPL